MNSYLGYDDFVGYYSNQFKAVGEDGAKLLAEKSLENLYKSMSTTGIVAQDGTTGADALKQEDLIPMILSTELASQYFAPFWMSLHKKPTISDVVQQTNMSSYGGGSRLGWMDGSQTDGGTAAQDPSLDRKALPVKWLGNQYQVFRSALAIQALGLGVSPDEGNAEQVAAEARLQRLILNANEQCWWGNYNINSNEPLGVIEQIRDANTAAKPTRFNLNGAAFDQEVFSDIKRILYQNGGMWTETWAPPAVLSDIEKQLIAGTRFSPGEVLTLSNYADQVLTQALGGDVARAKIRRDKVLDDGLMIEPTVADNGAPTAPASVAGTPSSAGTTNVWGSYLPAGTYYYSAVAVGVKGRSVPTATTAVVTTAGEKVTLTITNAAQAAGTVKYFEIYRGTSTGNRKFLGRVAGESVGSGGTKTFVDDGEKVPGTSTVVSLCNLPLAGNNYGIQVRQLLPIMKIKLPTALFAEQGGWVLGFTPQVCQPEFNLVIENVGQLS